MIKSYNTENNIIYQNKIKYQTVPSNTKIFIYKKVSKKFRTDIYSVCPNV